MLSPYAECKNWMVDVGGAQVWMELAIQASRVEAHASSPLRSSSPKEED